MLVGRLALTAKASGAPSFKTTFSQQVLCSCDGQGSAAKFLKQPADLDATRCEGALRGGVQWVVVWMLDIGAAAGAVQAEAVQLLLHASPVYRAQRRHMTALREFLA